MGMTYIIGYNEYRSEGEQWTEVDCNSTEDAYIGSFIRLAIAERYPELYEHMELNTYFGQFNFDELSQTDFMKVVSTIRLVIKIGDYPQDLKYGAEAWNAWFEPLILIDERYDPDYVLVE